MHAGNGFFMNNQNDNIMQLFRFLEAFNRKHVILPPSPTPRGRGGSHPKFREFALTVEVIWVKSESRTVTMLI